MSPRLGPIVRRHRQRRGLTLEQLAAHAGLAANYLGRIEREESIPGVGTVALLERALDLRPGRLMADAAKAELAAPLTA